MLSLPSKSRASNYDGLNAKETVMLTVPQGKVDRQELLLANTIIACPFFPPVT